MAKETGGGSPRNWDKIRAQRLALKRLRFKNRHARYGTGEAHWKPGPFDDRPGLRAASRRKRPPQARRGGRQEY